MKREPRDYREFILLMLCAAGIVAVTPFALVRLLNQNWLLFALDGSLVVILAALSAYVVRSHNYTIAATATCTICQLAIIGTVYIAGSGQIFWVYPAIIIAYYLLRPFSAFLVNLVSIAVLTPRLLQELSLLELATLYTTLAVTIAFSYAFSWLTDKQRRQVQQMATRDPLTGAGNRRALRDRLAQLVAKHHRHPSASCLLLIDLDHFKKINDDFGHAKGDDTLVGVVALLQERLRETDRIYRFGGEEFVIVTEQTSCQVATTLAEDLRELVASTPVISERQVTISVGVAQLNRGENTDDWLRRADIALYDAKDAGRNTTISAPLLSEAELAAAHRSQQQAG